MFLSMFVLVRQYVSQYLHYWSIFVLYLPAVLRTCVRVRVCRSPVLKEENGTPYPVLDMLDEEVAFTKFMEFWKAPHIWCFYS